MDPSEVIIVGCGVLGACAAYSFLKASVSTIVLEQYSTHLHQNGASFGQARCWRVAYTNPIYANMMTKSLKIWKEIEHETSTNLLSYCGGLRFGDKTSKAMKSIINTLKAYNFKHKILSSQETMKQFKPMQLPQNYYSIHIANQAGTINANKSLNAIIKCIKQLNGSIKYNAKVIKVDINASNKYKYNVYVNNGNVYKTNNVIFACGPYKLPPMINNYNYNIIKRINDSIKPIAANIVYFKQTNNNHINTDICNYPSWAEYDNNSTKWYGMISEQYTPFCNVCCMKVGDSHRNIKDNGVEYEEIVKYMKQRFGVMWKVFSYKKCYMSKNMNGIDDNLTIDRVNKNENIFVMNGHSHGFKHGPEMGNIIKNLVINNQKPNKLFQLNLCKESKL